MIPLSPTLTALSDASRDRLEALLATRLPQRAPEPPCVLPPPQRRSTTVMNPEVSSAWKTENDAAWAANRAAGVMFGVRAPTHEEIADRLGVALWVRRSSGG